MEACENKHRQGTLRRFEERTSAAPDQGRTGGPRGAAGAAPRPARGRSAATRLEPEKTGPSLGALNFQMTHLGYGQFTN